MTYLIRGGGGYLALLLGQFVQVLTCPTPGLDTYVWVAAQMDKTCKHAPEKHLTWLLFTKVIQLFTIHDMKITLEWTLLSAFLI